MTWLPFALPDITEAEIEEVVATLRSSWITTGPRAKKFEQAFAERVGASHAIAVNSCTAALHLALEALGVRAGDEVILPTLTFAATAEVVHYLGARPVLVDVSTSDHQIDPASVEAHITPRTRAIVPVHFGGQTCDMDALKPLAKAKNLPLVEDAAHAFPSTHHGRMVGTLGDITCFSFYATKTLTTGEGGMLTTENAEWAERMRLMSLHGISKDAWKRYSSEGSWYYEVLAPGFKYNLPDLAAALGIVQLARSEEMLKRRRAIAARYQSAFAQNPALDLLATHAERGHAWHLFVIRLVTERLRAGRDQFIQELRDLGIGTSVHFIPLHTQPYYRDAFGYAPDDLPAAVDCYRRSISLPIYSKMTQNDVERVIAAVTDLTTKFAR
jgi:dTDP-4-amino-4,6-dideoxygalactose transaminase